MKLNPSELSATGTLLSYLHEGINEQNEESFFNAIAGICVELDEFSRIDLINLKNITLTTSLRNLKLAFRRWWLMHSCNTA